MSGKTGVHPDCRNSSNPYHECSEFCFKVIAEAKKLAAKSEPVKSFVANKEDPESQTILAALLEVDPFDRTFKFKCTPAVRTKNKYSDTISTSKKSTGKFDLSDLEERATRRSFDVKPIAIELSHDTRPVTTYAKSTASRKRKVPDTGMTGMVAGLDVNSVEGKIHEFIRVSIKEIKNSFSAAAAHNAKMEIDLAEAEIKVGTATKMLAKEKAKVKALEERIEEMKAEHEAELTSIVEDAKDSAIQAIHQARLKLMREALDPNFDRSFWDLKAAEDLCNGQKVAVEAGVDVVEEARFATEFQKGDEGCEEKA